MTRSQISMAALLVAACLSCTPPEATKSSQPEGPSPAAEAKAPPEEPPRLGKKVEQQVERVVEAAPVDLELGPLLGKRSAKTPDSGRYASTIHARQHRFVTMEWTVSRSIRGGAMLELAEDGEAKGCAWSEAHDDSSKSKYATRDGKPSRNESDNEQRFGMRGSWKAQRTGILVEMDAVEYRNCEVGPDATEPSTPIRMHCFALDAGEGLPVAALACRVDETAPAIDAVAMLLADTPRSGSWELREDLARRAPDPTPTDAKPWLLLGATPGLHIEHDDGAREPLKVELTSKSVTPPVGETPTSPP